MQSPVTNQLILLILGFVLTTVFGGLLGSYFQNRTWKHQNRIKLAEAERMAATKVFESLSSLMDKRVYRMMQLNWKLRSDVTDDVIIEKKMEEYREVLYEWNDNLNRNLALVQSYFGTKIRNHLEITIYEKFRAIGKLLEKGYSERKRTGKVDDCKKSDLGLTKLRGSMYNLNLRMIDSIQKAEVGGFQS
jgi:hypothetical protein